MTSKGNSGWGFAASALLLSLLAHPVAAAPKADLWPYWEAHDPASTTRVAHGSWQRFLETYVAAGADGVQRVDYGRVSVADNAALNEYIGALAAVRVTALARAEQFPYWVNLYNALTVREILRHYPLASIRDLSSGFFTPGPWGLHLVTVEGNALTLDDIEHRILRPIWRDPRIHYVVNCAAVGCPDLRAQAFTRVNSEALLERAAHAYVNHPRGAARVDGELIVSRIYDWYQADFGNSERGVLAHLRAYAGAGLRTLLDGRTDIDGYRYDWSLNDARTN